MFTLWINKRKISLVKDYIDLYEIQKLFSSGGDLEAAIVTPLIGAPFYLFQTDKFRRYYIS